MYLNLYVEHLGQAGFHVGGLLGEDDHSDEANYESYGLLEEKGSWFSVGDTGRARPVCIHELDGDRYTRMSSIGFSLTNACNELVHNIEYRLRDVFRQA